MIWKILEIEKTKDEEAIKAAYHKKLRFVNPEDDAEGFKELRGAYDEAMAYANSVDEEVNENSEFSNVKKNEVDKWIDRIDQIYVDVSKRRNVELWKEILADPVCDDLDTELEAADKLLVYFMTHSYMPQNIWQAVEQRFHYEDNYKQLTERFPENYLEYVMWQIHHPQFIDYDLFEGKLDDKVDDYIGCLYNLRNAYAERDLEEARRQLNQLKRFDVSHPYGRVEEARILLSEEHFVDALEIMEELDFEYSDNFYVERIYAEALLVNDKVEQAEKIFDGILEDRPDDYGAGIGKARCVYTKGEYEDAKELVEDVLENRIQDPECMKLLNDINEHLVAKYTDIWEQEKDREIGFKLGWCYYQQRDFQKGIALLDSMEENLEEYDYINLRCRLYLANEDYELAAPLTRIWLELILNSPDDGTKDMTKRKNRESLAYFSIGICQYEETIKKDKEAKEGKKLYVSKNPFEEEFKEAENFIKKGIEIEENVMVRLSYMEQLAKYYIATERYEDCVAICNDIIQTDRGFYPAYVHRQRANYELKNAKEVIDDYFACKEIYEGYSVPYVLAAEVFTAFEQYEDVENILEDAQKAGIESDGLELYRIKCKHYKDFSNENVRIALDMLEVLIQKVEEKTEEDSCDIENMSELYREQVILLWDLDMTGKALSAVDAAISKVDKTDELLYLKIDILYREGRFQEAERICNDLIQRDPEHLGYRIKLGNIYERMDRTDLAIDLYEGVLKKNENSIPALRRMMFIKSYLSNEKNDLELCKQGIQYATRVIELTQAADAYVERGNLLIDLYELEKAVEDCKEAIALDSEAYYAYNNLGCALLKLRRIDEAIEPLKKVIEMDPDRDYLPYLNLADCYRLQRKYDLAIHAYNKVIDLKRQRGLSTESAEDDLVDLYCLNDEFDNAASVYLNEVLILEKKLGVFMNYKKLDNTQVYRMIKCYSQLAGVYQQKGDWEAAQKMYAKAEKVFYKCGAFASCSEIEDMAEFYRDKGENKRALEIINRLLAHEENCFGKKRRQSIEVLASILYNSNYFEEAKQYAEQCIGMFLEEYAGEQGLMSDRRYLPARLYTMAMNSLYAGNIEKAKEYIQKIPHCHLCVICENSDCFEYYYAMGMIYKAEGDVTRAKECFEKAKIILPFYPECDYQLRRLM